MTRKLLILDLDETLIHASESDIDTTCDYFRIDEYVVYKRPNLEQFLSFCRNNFMVAVWTSASEEFAHEVVEVIFGPDYPLEFVFARDRCVRKQNITDGSWLFIKDLKKVKRKDYSLEHVIIVDDTPAKLRRNYGNHIQIRPFEGDAEDCELTYLMGYLLELKNLDNVRLIEKRGWRTRYANSD